MVKISVRRRQPLSWHSFKRYIRRDKHRHATLRELWRLEKVERSSSWCAPQLTHDSYNPIRVRAMVHLLPSYICSVSRGVRLLTRLVASTEHRSKPDFAVAGCGLHEWDVCAVARLWFAAANASP